MAANVTRKHIEEFLRLESRVHELRREASDLAKLADELEDRLMAFALENGGPDRTCIRSGWILAVKEARGSVAWKHEFVKVAGTDAAEKLVAAAPPKDVLSVEKA